MTGDTHDVAALVKQARVLARAEVVGDTSDRLLAAGQINVTRFIREVQALLEPLARIAQEPCWYWHEVATKAKDQRDKAEQERDALRVRPNLVWINEDGTSSPILAGTAGAMDEKQRATLAQNVRLKLQVANNARDFAEANAALTAERDAAVQRERALRDRIEALCDESRGRYPYGRVTHLELRAVLAETKETGE